MQRTPRLNVNKTHDAYPLRTVAAMTGLTPDLIGRLIQRRAQAGWPLFALDAERSQGPVAGPWGTIEHARGFRESLGSAPGPATAADAV